MPATSIETLAQQVQGELRGDRTLIVTGAASLEKAGPHEISFALDDRHIKTVAASRAGACIVGKAQGAKIDPAGKVLVLVDDPLEAFLSVLRVFRPQRDRPAIGVSPAAFVSSTAQLGPGCNVYPGVFVDDGAIIGPNCELYPGVVIGRDCRIGANCTLYPHVVLYADVVLGDRVIVHASAVLGADGFGYRFKEGQFVKIPQLGSVHVHNDCEIGACTTIDRGMIGPTVIGAGTKLDNLVMIGHNCELGRHNAFASQVGLAGSVTTGDYVRCAGQVGIKDHIHLGAGSVLGAKSGVHKDVPAGETHVGYPAGLEKDQLRIVMSLNKVPEMRKQIRELESRLAELTQQLQGLVAQNSNRDAA